MVSGFGADMSFWVWSRSNGIISASSNPTKSFNTTNPNSTKTMPSNPTISTSSATPSNDVVLTNDYLVIVIVLINRRKSLASLHRSLSCRSSSFFLTKSIVPIVFTASREKYNLLVVGLLVSVDAYWRRRLSEL